jgi:hypothetical protein
MTGSPDVTALISARPGSSSSKSRWMAVARDRQKCLCLKSSTRMPNALPPMCRPTTPWLPTDAANPALV